MKIFISSPSFKVVEYLEVKLFRILCFSCVSPGSKNTHMTCICQQVHMSILFEFCSRGRSSPCSPIQVSMHKTFSESLWRQVFIKLWFFFYVLTNRSELFERQSQKMVKHTQTIRRLFPRNYLNVSDYFAGLEPKGLRC